VLSSSGRLVLAALRREGSPTNGLSESWVAAVADFAEAQGNQSSITLSPQASGILRSLIGQVHAIETLQRQAADRAREYNAVFLESERAVISIRQLMFDAALAVSDADGAASAATAARNREAATTKIQEALAQLRRLLGVRTEQTETAAALIELLEGVGRWIGRTRTAVGRGANDFAVVPAAYQSPAPSPDEF